MKQQEPVKWHRVDIAVDLDMPFGAAVNAAEDVALTESSDAPDEVRESLTRPAGAVVDIDVVSKIPCCHRLPRLVVPCLSPYSTWRHLYAGVVATEYDKASVMA